MNWNVYAQDWISAAMERGLRRLTDPLSESEYDAANPPYPRCEPECCCACSEPTGRVNGLYTDDGAGPFCWKCFEEEQP